jgi:hypothetical protein
MERAIGDVQLLLVKSDTKTNTNCAVSVSV